MTYSIADALAAVRASFEDAPDVPTTWPTPRLWPPNGVALPIPSSTGKGYSYSYLSFWVWAVAGRYYAIAWTFSPLDSSADLGRKAKEACDALIVYVQGLLPLPAAPDEVPSNPGAFDPDGGRLPQVGP